jgi:hypothetical protein
LLDSHAAGLSEHFDAVQILASYLEPDGTTAAVASGQGNWYARQGSVDAPRCLRRLVVKQAVNRKAYLGSAFRPDGVPTQTGAAQHGIWSGYGLTSSGEALIVQSKGRQTQRRTKSASASIFRRDSTR